MTRVVGARRDPGLDALGGEEILALEDRLLDERERAIPVRGVLRAACVAGTSIAWTQRT